MIVSDVSVQCLIKQDYVSHVCTKTQKYEIDISIVSNHFSTKMYYFKVSEVFSQHRDK